jgi:hypothetical protein
MNPLLLTVPADRRACLLLLNLSEHLPRLGFGHTDAIGDGQVLFVKVAIALSGLGRNRNYLTEVVRHDAVVGVVKPGNLDWPPLLSSLRRPYRRKASPRLRVRTLDARHEVEALIKAAMGNQYRTATPP